jgi:hypothetical protein
LPGAAVISARAIAEARREILAKAPPAIELETSQKWAARALAAYQISSDDFDLVRFAEAVEFHHEAVEHASGVSPTFLANIVALLGEAREHTIAVLTSPPDEGEEQEPA